MRLKAELFAKAYVRRCATADVAAMVVRHGDNDAGTIWIKISRLDGTAALYGPAPAGLESDLGERMMSVHLAAGTVDGDVESYLERQRRFDSDLWLIEVEDRQGRHFLDDWLAP